MDLAGRIVTLVEGQPLRLLAAHVGQIITF